MWLLRKNKLNIIPCIFFIFLSFIFAMQNVYSANTSTLDDSNSKLLYNIVKDVAKPKITAYSESDRYIINNGSSGSFHGTYDDWCEKYYGTPSYVAQKSLYQCKEKEVSNGVATIYKGNHEDKYGGGGTNNIYYYVSSDKNYVVFANYCWKILRTTDTGGVKLLYYGTYSSNACKIANISNTNVSNSLYTYLNLGYKFDGIKTNQIDSELKYQIDKWYETNLQNYENNLEDVVYCSDRSGSSKINSVYDSSIGVDRKYLNSNFFGCFNDKDKFSVSNPIAKLKYPIGAPTLGEIAVGTIDNEEFLTITPNDCSDRKCTSFYTGSDTLSMSSKSNYYSYYYSYYSKKNYNYYLRPVVSLKSGIKVNSGTGVKSSPYIVDAQPVGVIDNSKTSNCGKVTTKKIYDKVTNDISDCKYGEKYDGEHADKYDGTSGGKDIYYYTKSGHNNVKLGYYCWQAFRTTDTGGVKLVFNGIYTSDKKCTNAFPFLDLYSYNSHSLNDKSIGYMYNGKGQDNDTDSMIKAYIDDWYDLMFTDYYNDYGKFLEDTVFCNERNSAYPSKYTRYSDLYCYNEKDRFSVNNPKAKLKYPIGLITYPEYILSKDVIRSTSDGVDKALNVKGFWSMSPASSTTLRAADEISNAEITACDRSCPTQIGVRPVISLKGDDTYSNGDGSPTNPYVLGDSNISDTAIVTLITDTEDEENKTELPVESGESINEQQLEKVEEKAEEIKNAEGPTIKVESSKLKIDATSLIKAYFSDSCLGRKRENEACIKAVQDVTDKVSWKVEDSSIIKLEDNKITGLKEGTTSISASYTHNDGVVVTSNYDVEVVGADYCKSKLEILIGSIKPGETKNLSISYNECSIEKYAYIDEDCRCAMYDVRDKVTFKVEDSSIVKLNNNAITGLKEGTTKITAIYKNSSNEDITNSIDVTVSNNTTSSSTNNTTNNSSNADNSSTTNSSSANNSGVSSNNNSTNNSTTSNNATSSTTNSNGSTSNTTNSNNNSNSNIGTGSNSSTTNSSTTNNNSSSGSGSNSSSKNNTTSSSTTNSTSSNSSTTSNSSNSSTTNSSTTTNSNSTSTATNNNGSSNTINNSTNSTTNNNSSTSSTNKNTGSTSSTTTNSNSTTSSSSKNNSTSSTTTNSSSSNSSTSNNSTNSSSTNSNTGTINNGSSSTAINNNENSSSSNSNDNTSNDSNNTNQSSLDSELSSESKDAIVGWYTDKEKTKEFDTDDKIKEDTVLYAKWKSEDVKVADTASTKSIIVIIFSLIIISIVFYFVYKKYGDLIIARLKEIKNSI